MYYQGFLMNIEEYFRKRWNEIETHNYPDEDEWNIIAEYISSCGLEKEEVKFIYKHGFIVWDFVDENDLSDSEYKHFKMLEEVV